MKSNFDACMAEVFSHEGGYVNDPHDPGGETNMGISKRSYPREDIRNMTRARAAQIYRRDFWNAVRGDELPAGLDLVAFDAAVNSGPKRSIQWLQAGVGADVDGKIGPKTIAAANAVHLETAITRATRVRLDWLRVLPTWKRYGDGWTSRVNSVRSVAHVMAAAKPSGPTSPVPKAESPIPGLLIGALIIGVAVLLVLAKG